jgi:tRNA uridine 5-carbamoylmethylation protein Kti12
MYFEIISEIIETETIAVGSKIREIARLRKQFGKDAGEN